MNNSIKSLFALFVIATLSPASSTAQYLMVSNRSPEGLTAVYQGGKWGFVNGEGKWVVQPYYDEVGPFREQRAAVKIGTSFGYFDEKGSLVLRPKQSTRTPFEEKVRWVSVVENRWGFIGTNGEFVLKPTYDEAGGFYEGKAAARVGQKWGFLDLAGKWTIAPQFEDVGHFFEGLAKAKKNGRWGYINDQGTWVIEPIYRWAGRFSENLAVAAVGERYGYINAKGEWAITPQFFEARRFQNGVAAVAKEHDQWGLIQQNGTFTIEPQYKSITPMVEGRLAVRSSNDETWTFTDTKGKPLSPQTYEDVHVFSEKKVSARLNGKYGFLNQQLQWAIDPQFDQAFDFVENRAVVLKEKVWHIIDPQGRSILQFDYISLRLPFNC